MGDNRYKKSDNIALKKLFTSPLGSVGREALGEMIVFGVYPQTTVLALDEILNKQLNPKPLINENEITPQDKKQGKKNF